MILDSRSASTTTLNGASASQSGRPERQLAGGATNPSQDPVPRGRKSNRKARDRRRRVLEGLVGPLPSLTGVAADPEPETFRGNIENFVGMVRVPMGIIGPLRVNGSHARGDFYAPLATSEGALVASYNRGANLISRSGGAAVLTTVEHVQRAPCFVFETIAEAALCSEWIAGNFDRLAGVAATRSGHGRLQDVSVHLEGNHLFVVLWFHTGDAAGQNMTTFCAEAVCNEIADRGPVRPRRWYLESNLSGDKKASAYSFQSSRGRNVSAEVVMPRDLVTTRLHTTPEEIASYWQIAAVGAIQSGSIGVNGHVANGLAGLFLACGQDVACVSEASVGLTRFEVTPDGHLYASVTLPNLIVGTVGGGTRLPTARECLRILDCEGNGKASKLAEICAAVALAGEISLGGAMCAGDFSAAHRKLGRPSEPDSRLPPDRVEDLIWSADQGGAIPSASEIGGKAHNLALLDPDKVSVPRWIVIRTGAYRRFHAGLPGTQDDGSAVPQNVSNRELAGAEAERLASRDHFRQTVLRALRAAGLWGVPLAVRSSAAVEDGQTASFAGQFHTTLGVTAEGDGTTLWSAIQDVWTSANAANGYLQQVSGVGQTDMAVVIQEMVIPLAAGVAFSADPVSGQCDRAIVCAVHGFGEGLVNGDLDADTYRVVFESDGTVDVTAESAHKDRAILWDDASGELRITPVAPELRDAPVLATAEAERIAGVARQLEQHRNAPQDVEWALVRNTDSSCERTLLILQTRPITALGRTPGSNGGNASPRSAAPEGAGATDGDRRVWDNSNIVESYGGVTSPLTFSFARRVYERAFRGFSRFMGIREADLQSNADAFANMLGLVRGRVYYNLLNWYRLLALFPGYALNRDFLDRMLGVTDRAEGDTPGVGQDRVPPWRDALRVARALAGIARAHLTLPRHIANFHKRVDRVLCDYAHEDLRGRNLDRLKADFDRLEEELLRHWQPPRVNDFFAMIYFGLLNRLVGRWLPNEPASLVNDLLVAEGGVISVELPREARRLANRVRSEPGLWDLFHEEPSDARLAERLRADDRFEQFRSDVDRYVERFGDRCSDELKLETVTPKEDPSLALAMIRRLVTSTVEQSTSEEPGHGVRLAAEATVRASLPWPKRVIFGLVLRHSRDRIRDRENLRFERTRAFGAVRRIFRSFGERLTEVGSLQAADDVFYLGIDEIFAEIEGTSVSADLATLAAGRRLEFEGFAAEPPPPDRFETFGPLSISPVVPATRSVHDGSLEGTGCCPGVVRGQVRVVRDPLTCSDVHGRIVVAERTDPGWALIFPAASGLLVQRGSLLSHSAIVAREMGLPCVVGIRGLIGSLSDGDWVEMNGTTGFVRRLTGDER